MPAPHHITHITRRTWLATTAATALPWAALAADPPRQPWPKGKPTPALQLPSLEGPDWSLATAKGKPLLLNFWASWCPPCRDEMPSLELLATRYQAQGLQVLAINFRETDAAVKRFIEATAFSLPVLRDRDGAAAQAMGARTFPTTVAIGRNGQALFSVTGEVDWTGPTARQWMADLV